MSTRSLICFSYDNDLKLKPYGNTFIYIHHDGYPMIRFKEILKYIKKNGFINDIQYDTRVFINWYTNNINSSIGVEGCFNNTSLKRYCEDYIEVIYKVTNNHIIIYNMYLKPLFKISFSSKYNGKNISEKGFEDHMDISLINPDDEILNTSLKYIQDKIYETNFTSKEDRIKYKVETYHYLDL